jgi:hypothetical protein
LKASLIALFTHAFVLMVLAVLTFIALAFSLRLRGWTLAEAWEEYAAELILCFLVVPILTGMWLTAGLRHCTRWKIWIGWAMLIAALFSMEAVFHGIGRLLDISYYIHQNPARLKDEWFRNLGTLATMMMIAMAGMPVGWKLLNAYARHRRHYWRKRRRRRRHQRSLA